MDRADDGRTGEHEQIVVALEVLRMAGEARAAEALLVQALPLDHRPHGAVENQDALGEQPIECFKRCHQYLPARGAPPPRALRAARDALWACRGGCAVRGAST